MSTPPTEFVPRAEPVWLAALRGDDHELRQLAEHLASDELRLHTLGAEWVAYTSRLQHHTTGRGFHDQAISDLLPLLGTLGRRIEPHGVDIQLGPVLRLQPDGKLDTNIFAAMAALEAGGLPAMICGESGADQIARLAWSRPEVMQVLRFRESPDRDLWSGLYRVVEGVAEDMGGDPVLVRMDWTSRNWLTLFGRTANSSAAGPSGRHGRTKFDPPPKPMTLEEARRGVREIFNRWIDWKLGQLARSLAPDDDH